MPCLWCGGGVRGRRGELSLETVKRELGMLRRGAMCKVVIDGKIGSSHEDGGAKSCVAVSRQRKGWQVGA